MFKRLWAREKTRKLGSRKGEEVEEKRESKM
jgi:hypothetical protein